jgi:alkylresorcinol/alkylpyrone synthase
MLQRTKPVAAHRMTATGFDVEILSVATANPSFQVTQKEAAEQARALYPHLEALWPLYDNAGIEARFNCEPIDWYLEPHTWEDRTASFQKHALDLLEQVTLKATEAAGVGLGAIDMLVANTVTGLAVPSLDAMLLNRLKLAPTMERLPIFGFGCGGGVAGLARATRLAHATEGAHVLFVSVDLCSLCLRINDPSAAMFVSGALFGDGAAGVLLHNTAGGASGGPRILAVGERCWYETEHIMGWDIKNDGFGIVLSAELPAFVRKSLLPALHEFLDRHGFRLSEFDGFLFHPGGRKVLETVEEVLGLERKQLEHSWEVLRRYGNMSAATVLFVLERALRAGARGRHLLAALGPGFSVYFVVADL